ALRGRVPLPSILVQVREIEKDSVGRSNDGQAITFWIKRKSQARCEAFPIVRLPCIGIWNSAFALKINARRRVGIDGAHKALIEPVLVEERAFTRRIVGRPIRLPPQAAVQCQALGCLPCVWWVERNI